jgi:hypothetical protein
MMSITMSADAANPMVLICFGRATRRFPSAVIESQGEQTRRSNMRMPRLLPLDTEDE